MGNLIGNFTGFDGRLNRQPFWISSIILIVVSVVISLLILPLLGLSILPNINLSTGATAEEVAAIVSAAQSRGAWIGLVLFVILMYPSAAICIKRRHDRNSSGIDIWIYFGLALLSQLLTALGVGMTVTDMGNGIVIPTPGPISMVLGVILGIFAIYLLVVLGFLKGTAGPNQYGPDPLGG